MNAFDAVLVCDLGSEECEGMAQELRDIGIKELALEEPDESMSVSASLHFKTGSISRLESIRQFCRDMESKMTEYEGQLRNELAGKTRGAARLRPVISQTILFLRTSVDEQEAFCDWINTGELLSFAVGEEGSERLLPLFQFRENGTEVAEEVREVNQRLGADEDPWGVYSWWVAPSGRLGGEAPADVIEVAPADVVSLAYAVGSDAGL